MSYSPIRDPPLLYYGERKLDSRLSRKQPEKDFFKENLRKIREIQSKCKGQDSKLSKNEPLKALHKESFLKKNQRIGSGHSDYFSLSDGLPTVHHSNKLYDPNLYKSSNSPIDTQNVLNSPSQNLNIQNLNTNLLRSQSKSLNCLRGQSSYAHHHNLMKKPPLQPYRNLQSPMHQKGQVASVLSKVKSRKPSCDTHPANVWHCIESDHKSLFGKLDHLMVPNELHNINYSEIRAISHRSPALSLRRSPSLSEISCKSYQQKDKASDPFCARNADSSSPNPRLSSVISPHKSIIEIGTERSSPLERNPSDVSSRSLSRTSSLPKLSFVDSVDNNQSNNPITNVSSFAPSFSKNIAQQSKLRPTQEKILNNVMSDISKARTKCQMRRSKSSGNLKVDPPSTYKRGAIPKYLLAKKEEERKRQEAAIVDPECPPGHTLLPDIERKNTLDLLFKGQADVLSQISRLPLVHDTLRVKRLHEELEEKLCKIEEGISIFSQHKVYVIDD